MKKLSQDIQCLVVDDRDQLRNGNLIFFPQVPSIGEKICIDDGNPRKAEIVTGVTYRINDVPIVFTGGAK